MVGAGARWRTNLIFAFRLGGVVTAVALAYAAQGLLLGDFHLAISNRQVPTAAGVGLLAGGILFGLMMPRPAEESEESRPGLASRIPSPRLLGVAIAVYLTSVTAYLVRGENTLVLWAWAVATVCLVVACWDRSVPRSRGAALRDWTDWLLPLGLILPVALVLRLWRLDTVPLVVFGDLAFDGLETRALLDGTTKNLIAWAWGFSPRTNYLPQMLSMAIFGQTLFGLDMSSVLTGMASLVGTYLLGAELYNRRVGWLATGLLAVSYTHLHFSRVAHGIDPEPWVVFSLFFLARAVRNGRSLDAALGGVMAGVAFQMYAPGRLIVLLAALFALQLFLTRRFDLRQWVITGLAFLVAMGPITVFFLEHWGQLWQRSREISIFGNPKIMEHLQRAYGGVTRSQVVVEGIKRAFLAFVCYPNTFPERNIGRPIFDAFTGPLLALGLGYAALAPRRSANWLAASVFVAPVFLGVAITSDPPFVQRMELVLPFATILAALALDRIVGLFPLPKWVVTIGLLSVLGLVGWQNWTFFVSHESRRARPMDLAVRHAATLAPDRLLILIRPPWKDDFPEFRFMAPQVRMETVILEDAAAGRWPDAPGRPVVFFTPNHSNLLPVVQSSWPGGTLREFKLPDGRLAFYSYEAP